MLSRWVKTIAQNKQSKHGTFKSIQMYYGNNSLPLKNIHSVTQFYMKQIETAHFIALQCFLTIPVILSKGSWDSRYVRHINTGGSGFNMVYHLS